MLVLIYNAHDFMRFSLKNVGDRGRTASYPTAPSQTPACGITAPGSSVEWGTLLPSDLMTKPQRAVGDVVTF